MLYFPQLSANFSAQYPIGKRSLTRTAANEALDGSQYKLADDPAGYTEWTLQFQGLTDEEVNVIESFFHTVEGRLKSFTLLDPAGNLLRWSDDFGKTAWEKDSQLQLTNAVGDPRGGERGWRIRNSGSLSGRVKQTLQVPNWYRYCASIYARGGPGTSLTLFVETPSRTETMQPALRNQWERFSLSAAGHGQGECVSFGIELPPGSEVDVFGMQAEPQAAASGYRTTYSIGGVYPEARLLEDALTITTEAPNWHSCGLRVGAKTAG